VNVSVRDLGRSDYQTVFEAMRSFTEARGETTADDNKVVLLT